MTSIKRKLIMPDEEAPKFRRTEDYGRPTIIGCKGIGAVLIELDGRMRGIQDPDEIKDQDEPFYVCGPETLIIPHCPRQNVFVAPNDQGFIEASPIFQDIIAFQFTSLEVEGPWRPCASVDQVYHDTTYIVAVFAYVNLCTGKKENRPLFMTVSADYHARLHASPQKVIRISGSI